MSVTEVAEWVLCGAFLVVLIASAIRAAVRAERIAGWRVMTRLRARRAERVAVEASVEDPAFSPEVVRASVTEMLEAAEAVWAGREDGDHRQRADIQLIRGWAASRGRQIGRGLRIVGQPRIDLVSVVNREQEAEDRAVVRLHLRIHRDPKASATEAGDGTILAQRTISIEERWTLARRGELWLLAAIGGDPILDVKIHSPLIASPEQDEGRVRESALRELARGEHTPTSELDGLTGADLPTPDRLRELSVLDDRFSPDLLEAALRHLVQAWEDYADGSRAPLEGLATDKAIRALIHPGNGPAPHLIRDAELGRWKTLDVTPGARPARVRVRVEIESAAVAANSHWNEPDQPRSTRILVWTLELTPGAGDDPEWRLTHSVEA